MQEAKLTKIYDGPEKEINIFVHGYRVIHSLDDYYKLAHQVLSAKPRGRVYLLFWKSGEWSVPRVLGVMLTLFTSEVLEFKHFQHLAELIGKSIKQHLGKIPNVKNEKLNFIGHSLGVRIICYALAFNKWSDYRIRNCILLGGEADNDPNLWLKCAQQIRGIIYNVYSKNDEVLKFLPTERVGTHPIRLKHSLQKKIVNRHYYTFGHTDYMKRLNYILKHLRPGYQQSKNFNIHKSLIPVKYLRDIRS